MAFSVEAAAAPGAAVGYADAPSLQQFAARPAKRSTCGAAAAGC